MALILVVDDNQSVRDVVRMMLERDSHRVVGAAHGEEALKLLENHAPEMALIDIEMPGMTGYELCARLRERTTWGTRPIALMTGRAITGVLERALAAGAQRMIPKPFARSELQIAIREMLAEV